MRKALLLALSSVFLSTSFADDLVGNKLSIIVSKNNQGMLHYELCDEDKMPKCRQLGSKNYYSVTELKQIANNEKWEAYGKTGGLALVAILTGGAGAAVWGSIGAATAGTVASTSTASMVAVGAGTSAGTVAVTGFVNKLNPLHQFDQADLLVGEYADGLMDKKDMKVSDEEIEDAATILDEIL